MVNKEITKIEGDMSIKPSSDPTIYGEGNLDISGDLNVLGNVSFGSSTISHNALTGLNADDHTQYTLLAGRTGGQVLTGGTASGNNVTIRSTSNATKGSVIFDETTATTSNSTGAVRLSGGLGISNTTDATSATNGGTITTAGGLAVAKKAFVGTDLSVGGNLTVTGTAALPHGGLTGLNTDDHTQYTLLSGRTGGQILTGGTAASNNATIRSTSNATKGSVIFDETTATTSNSTGAIRILGGLGISNTTDAISATNGGTITTAGGLAVAKKAFVGTDLSVGGNLTVTGTAALPHGGLTGLNTDDHVIYTLLAGRTGGQILTGGTAASNNTTIRSTSNAVKGSVVLDETTATTSSSSGALLLSGGLGISNTTDATSATNGGTITTAGGLSVARRAFVGTDLSVGGNLTVTGTANLPHGGLTGLSSDDHTIYTLLSGRTGGQILTGGTAASNNTTIRSTSNAVKGSVIFDETTATVSNSTGAIRILGGLGISNTTDATSATNGGTITTAGGLAVARRAFIGTDLSVGGNSSVLGNLTVTGALSFGSATIPHSSLTGLSSDDHTIYTLLAGRTGGQILTGGTAANNNTTIRSTSNAVKGSVVLDETTATTSSSSGALLLSGGLGISNTTDATSATNGGTITTAGGLSVARRAFVGTDLSVGGNLTVTGTAALPHGGLTGLNLDDHTIYTLLSGRTGGQILTGGTAASNNTTIRSTSNAVKGSVVLDETTATTSSSSGALLLSGGLGISNTTDATSATNGGTITTAGGLSVARRAFIGTDLSVGGNSSVLGNLSVTGALSFGSSVIPHSSLTGLTSDDHPIYTLLAGRTGGQILTGGTAASNNTVIRSTSNAVKGSVIFDETTATVSNSTGAVRLAGGLGISNTTDATSATNGGTITTAGGLSVAKKAFVGTDLSVGGNLTVTGTAALPHGGLTGLNLDDHTIYTLLSGRTGGQILTGGTAANNNTTIRSTSNAVKGSVVLDETTATTSSSSGALLLSGGLGISNATDATSATNGGTITTAGGLSVAKKAFVGTDLSVGGNLTVTGTAALPHGGLTGLNLDDHTIYTLLAGRTGGQILTGGTAANNNTTIRSTSNAVKGSVVLDETTATTSSSSGALLLSGGLGISNATDATSATNGGTITTAGGLSVAKKAFVGTDLSVGGNLTVTGTANLPHGGLTGLNLDDHTIYTLLAGRTGGQILTGGTAANNNTTIRSTSNAVKGSVVLDETTATTSSSSGALLLSGGLGISNTTDATSATNGGTITTAGGLSVARRAFIGTDLSVGGNSNVLGNLNVSGALSFGSSVIPHSSLTGLSSDDHTIYTLLAGRTGGQILTGGTAASNNTTIRSTSNAVKGSVIFDETTTSTNSSTGAVRLSGGLGISNTTDATSATNGGTITTAGGLAVARRAFIGTDLSVGGNSSVLGNLSVTGALSFGSSVIPHSSLSGLNSDDHTIYAFLAGRSGGQILTGGTAANNNTTIRSTSNAVKGSVVLDESTATTSSSSGALLLSGGLGISNTTDATSSISGGTITTAGGLAVARRAFIGTDLSVGGNLTVSGSASLPHGGLTGLSNDDHTIYALLAGRSGGQVIIGGTAASNNTTIRSTSNATKGSVIFDETTTSISSSTGAVRISGGLGISNTTDATSATNGGTITTAGGLSVAKKAFIGTDLSVGGNSSVLGNSNVLGNLSVTGALSFGSATIPHSSLTGLSSDDHSIYAFLAGRSGGQIFTGGTAASNNTTIRSTSNATKGSVVLDETTATTSSSSGALLLSGGLGISNTTDATSSINGGTITTAGGLSVAKKAFIGTDLSVGGNLTVTGTAAFPHSGLTGLSNDDHPIYTLLAGRTGGQTITGGTASGNNTTIRSTSNATKGSVIFDETTATVSSSTGAVRFSGGLGISNTTDAISATNGGTITTAGGLSVAKKAFVGTDLSVGGNFSVSGIATVPAPNPSNNGEIVNIGYLNSVGSTLPPKIYDDMALVTDLSEPTQTKWKGGSIYSPDIDLDKTRHLRLTKIGNQIINPGNSFINFGYRLNIDSSHFEQLYGKTAYIIKVPGRYFVSGTIITGTDSFSNSTTASYFIQLTEIVSGITTIRPGSEIYSTHATSTTLGTDSVSFGLCIVVPTGGSFFSMRTGRTSGASITSIRNGSNISVVSIADSEYLDVYSTAYTVLNNASYVDIPMTATYYADTLYNFTAPNANVGVTTTGTYLVSAKVTFLRPTVSGSNPVGRFRLVDQSGTPISDTFTGSVYNPYNGAVLVSNNTATWTGLLNITATTGTIKIQAIIDSGSGSLEAIGGLCLTSINTTAFPSQINFKAVSTSNQLLSTIVFNIPFQSTLINTGGISFTAGTTQITVTKSSLYCISGSIPLLVPLGQTNILVTVNVLVSYDNGSTFRNITTAPLVRLAANNMSIPFCFFTNLFAGARIRLTINTSGTLTDLVALGNNCSLSILSFDDLTTPVDLFPIKGSFYKFCENSEFLTLPSTTITVVNSIWSKYVPAGLYKISFNTSVGIGAANTVVSYTINQSAADRGDNAVYSRSGTYVSTGEYPLSFTRVVTFDKGINYIFVSITTNRVNTVTVTASLLDIERVI